MGGHWRRTQVVDVIRNGVRIPFKDGPPASFHQGVSMKDATLNKLRFVDGELSRFLASGAWKKASARGGSPGSFSSPSSPGVNKWRCIIDLRPSTGIMRSGT
eukprot:jgi/Tetstr1/439071/TSEL_027561.t1